jgi:hypothetical protein
MQNLSNLIEERKNLEQAYDQLNRTLDPYSLKQIEERIKLVTEQIEYIMEEDESSHGF